MANAIDQARERGLLGPDVHGRRLRLRHRDPPRRRRLHLRRGHGALRDRSRASAASRATRPPVPTDGGPVQQAHGRQQRRDARQHPGDHPGRRRRVRGARHAEVHRATSCSASPGHVARPGVYETEFGITLRDLIELAGGVPGGRAVKAVNLGGAAGVFVGPDAMHMPLTFEHAKEDGRDARRRARSSCSTRPPTCSTSSGASPSSSATSRAGSASRAAWAPCARRSCWRGSWPAGPAGPSPTSSRCSTDLGQVHARRLDLRPRPDRQRRAGERPAPAGVLA